MSELLNLQEGFADRGKTFWHKRLKYRLEGMVGSVEDALYTIPDTIYLLRHGYRKSDLNDLREWFCKVFPDMIEDFKKNSMGYPCGMTEEQWNEILTETANHIRAADYDYDYELKHGFEKELQRRDSELARGLDLLKWYMSGMWS
jgi:hypothetical protein